MAEIAVGISAVLSVFSFTFFCAGASAASYHATTVELVNWLYTHVASSSGTGDDYFNSGTPRTTLYFGLRAIASEVDGELSITNLSDCGDGSVCYNCRKSGRLVMAMMWLCIICSFFTIIASAIRLLPGFIGNKVAKFFGMVTTFITLGFSIAAVASFGHCHRAAAKEFGRVLYGPGYGLTFAAFCMLVIALILQTYAKGESEAPKYKAPAQKDKEVALSEI